MYVSIQKKSMEPCRSAFQWPDKQPKRVIFDTQPDTSGGYKQCMHHCDSNYQKYKDQDSHQFCAQYCHLADAQDTYAFYSHMKQDM